MSLPYAEHVGKAIDAKGYCEISDCWCRYCIDPLTSTHDVMVRALGVDIEDFKAPDGTIVDEDGFIVESGHPQEGVLWSSCQGADPSWKPRKEKL